MSLAIAPRVVTACLLLLAGASFITVMPTSCGTAGASPADALEADTTRPTPVRLETPDDPPGVPALPVPAAPPSQGDRFRIFTSVQVNVGPGGSNIPGDAANEPSIAVDPTDPLKIAIAWRQFDTVSSNFRQAGYAYSEDEGRTWTFPGVLTPGSFRSDPVLSFDTDGGFYYNSLQSSFIGDVFRSTNGGQSWGPPISAFGGDKTWMTIDRSGGIGNGHIYAYWSDFAGCCGNNVFTRSTNGGTSYQTPIALPGQPHFGTLDVGPDGTLYIVGVDSNLNNFVVTKSTNAQNPAVTPTFSAAVTVNLGGTIVLFPGAGGPNPDGLMGQPWIAVDPSPGPTSGYVYIVGSVDPPGTDPMDVYFTRSTNGGANWSTPVRLNTDPAGANAWQWFGTMSVAPNGRIDVVWNDTSVSGVANQSALFYRFSTDGGTTWAATQQLSNVWNSHLGFPSQNKIGDYYHMISDRVGAHLAWAATFNGEEDVYYLRINDYDCNGNGVGDTFDIGLGHSPDANGNGIPDECEEGVIDVPETVSSYRLLRSFPNPLSSSSTIAFEITGGEATVRLRIFDVEGRLVRTLLDGRSAVGETRVAWDGLDQRGARVSPGLYLCRLEGPGFDETQRMLLLK